MSTEYFKEALNTVKASRIELWLARILGKKKVVEAEGLRLTFYWWRGKSYLVDREWKNR